MYSRPDNLPEVLQALDQKKWRILSGGTDFYPSFVGQPVECNIMDVSSVRGLKQIKEEEDGTICIGALVTWNDLMNFELPSSFDGIKLAAKEVGSIQIQNRATIVGNICNASPAADGIPPLLTLNAKLRLESVRGLRELKLSEFVLGNRRTAIGKNELVTHIIIPGHSNLGKSHFIKLGSRKYLVISISMVSARIYKGDQGNILDAAISVGSCSIVAKRLFELEKTLIGVELSEDIVDLIEDKHLNELSPINDVRSTKDYRIKASKELVIRVLKNIVREYQ